MNRKRCFLAIFCLFCAVSGELFAVGEKTMRLKADSIWEMANFRAGITEVNQVRPAPVLVLSSATGPNPASSLDLALSFDEGRPALFRDSAGRYQVSVSPILAVVDEHYARMGFGAALFPDDVLAGDNADTVRTSAPVVVKAQNTAALFAPNNRIYDFSMEFWMHPLNLENGEQVVQWISSSPIKKAGVNNATQRILCVSSKNRLQWSFTNFFAAPDGVNSLNIELSGHSAVVPKTWSHHLIRFDSINGMVEYLVNGKTEAIEYATSTGHEGGEVYTPIAGEGGSFILGSGFSGMLDEFKIYHNHPRPVVQKYPMNGGRIETRALDLGEGSNGILKLEASGGKVAVRNAKINSEYKQNGRFRFSDDSEMQFFIRSSDNPYRWDHSWRSITPGADLNGSVNGRYVQLAVDFYPSANGEVSPYLEELAITYFPDEPPLPPAQLTAIAMDGAVQLRWKNSPDQKTQGYLIYYGTSSDDYFGEDSALGGSPIDAGKKNTIYINGLKNGTLYYFRVAAYSNPHHIGEFSREVRARPLK